MEPINVEFEWSRSHYKEAQGLYLSFQKKVLKFILGLSVATIAVAVIVAAADEGARQDPEFLGTTGGLALCTLFLAALPKFQGFLHGLFFKLDRLEGRPLAYRIAPEGLQMSGPDADSKVKWTLFNRWLEGPNLFVLLAGRLMYMVPKDRLGEREDDLRQLLTEKIGPKGKKRPK